ELSDALTHGAGVGDVERDGPGHPAGCGLVDVLARAGEGFGVPPVQDDACAVLGQASREGEAETAGGAGHQGEAVGEVEERSGHPPTLANPAPSRARVHAQDGPGPPALALPPRAETYAKSGRSDIRSCLNCPLSAGAGSAGDGRVSLGGGCAGSTAPST